MSSIAYVLDIIVTSIKQLLNNELDYNFYIQIDTIGGQRTIRHMHDWELQVIDYYNTEREKV